MQLQLPDVSEFQPNVDWAKVAQHNGGAAIIRALYGTSHVDKAWYGGARRTDAHQHGIGVLGIYQYLVAGQDPVAQAKAFVNLVGGLRPGEFAIIDVEEGDGNQAARTKAWLDYVDQHLYGGHPGSWVYSGASFFGTHGLMPFANGSRHTWVASYGSTPPKVPHTLWQNSDKAPWPGIGNCDNSIYNGTLMQLRHALVSPHH